MWDLLGAINTFLGVIHNFDFLVPLPPSISIRIYFVYQTTKNVITANLNANHKLDIRCISLVSLGSSIKDVRKI